MAIIDAVRDYIQSKCPLVDGKKIKLNYLGEACGAYSVEAVPGNPIVKRYVDGGSLRQFIFSFGSREYYGKEDIANLDVATFYDEFSEWIEAQDAKKVFPALGEGLKPLGIEVKTSGYLFDATQTAARYQIQCVLTYYKD